MKKVSNTLFGCADAFFVFSIIFFVASFVGFIIDSAWSGGAFKVASYLLILTPFVRGFGTLVKNAEEEMAHRFDVKLEKDDDEK